MRLSSSVAVHNTIIDLVAIMSNHFSVVDCAIMCAVYVASTRINVRQQKGLRLAVRVVTWPTLLSM